MKAISTLMIVFLVTATGCSEESRAAGKEALENAGQHLKEAGEDLATLMKLGRDEFTQWGSQRMQELDAKVRELREQGGEQAQEAVKRLEELREKAGAELERMKESSGEAWKDLREGFVDAIHEFERNEPSKEGK